MTNPMTTAQMQSLEDALHRIVISDAVAMELRVAALQGIEDLEMGAGGDKMLPSDVHTYTADWSWAKDRAYVRHSDPYPNA